MRSLTPDDVAYAMETTRVVHEPDRRIDTFGTTHFEYCLITELMDVANRVRVREGKVDAGRPRILRPNGHEDIEIEGFGEHAEAFREWLKQADEQFAMLQYGFRFASRDMTESVLQDTVDAVVDRAVEEVRATGNPSRAIIVGVDDTWDISLLKFAGELVMNSSETNQFDLKRRGLI